MDITDMFDDDEDLREYITPKNGNTKPREQRTATDLLNEQNNKSLFQAQTVVLRKETAKQVPPAAVQEMEISLALYKADAERIWKMLPGLRDTEEHYTLPEAVQELQRENAKLREGVKTITEYMQMVQEQRQRIAELERKLAAIDTSLDFDPDEHHTIADMANVGKSLMDALNQVCPDYFYSDSPAEIVSDLTNAICDLERKLAEQRRSSTTQEN